MIDDVRFAIPAKTRSAITSQVVDLRQKNQPQAPDVAVLEEWTAE